MENNMNLQGRIYEVDDGPNFLRVFTSEAQLDIDFKLIDADRYFFGSKRVIYYLETGKYKSTTKTTKMSDRDQRDNLNELTEEAFRNFIKINRDEIVTLSALSIKAKRKIREALIDLEKPKKELSYLDIIKSFFGF